jgi:molecular chaperone GrpE
MAKKTKNKEVESVETEEMENVVEATEPEVIKSPEEELQGQVDELNDKYLRLYSDFENFRKRTAKERIDLSKTASASVMESLLPVLDDFERAMATMKDAQDVKAIEEGVNLIYEKLNRELATKGLEKFNPTGEVFDAELHEAITQIPAPSDDMKGKVVDTVENGYKLGEKVIRYAKVVVGA